MQGQHRLRERAGRTAADALLAGAVAVAVNLALLSAARWIPLATGNGVLLKVIQIYLGRQVTASGLPALWTGVGLPGPENHFFLLSFHTGVGLLMALAYAFVIEPILRGSPWVKGSVYAAGVWLINAFAALPLIGAGIAGIRTLSLGGILYFAVAHTVFFVLLAELYARAHRLNPGRR